MSEIVAAWVPASAGGRADLLAAVQQRVLLRGGSSVDHREDSSIESATAIQVRLYLPAAQQQSGQSGQSARLFTVDFNASGGDDQQQRFNQPRQLMRTVAVVQSAETYAENEGKNALENNNPRLNQQQRDQQRRPRVVWRPLLTTRHFDTELMQRVLKAHWAARQTLRLEVRQFLFSGWRDLSGSSC